MERMPKPSGTTGMAAAIVAVLGLAGSGIACKPSPDPPAGPAGTSHAPDPQTTRAKQVFYELIQAEDRAADEAMEKYPVVAGMRTAGEEEMRRLIRGFDSEKTRLMAVYKGEVRQSTDHGD